ncbi:uncharacterized protein LOC132205365 [Neocloeon triangulifer]|uniref:uncharacterized protein LOC132205365 n=1 Tax=Neocloeon triangulifer TaxID=2078957 RepID=UPI00286F896E|nr:uncharacterized protein LOC132205365 [Neocloeon triangulifer]
MMSSGPNIGSPFPGSSESSKRGPIPPQQPPGGLNLNGPRISPDFRNGDFLSRLLAATPPYLYNIPLVPQSFFFSDMLKSFVQSSNNNNNNNNAKSHEMPPHPPHLRDSQIEFPSNEMQKDLPGRPPHRRRKRTWREVSDPPRFAIDRKPPPILDKPLELTTKHAPEEKMARHEGPLTPPFSSPPLDQSRTSPSSTTSPPLLPPPPPPLMLPNLPHCGMLPLPDFNRLVPTSSDSSSSSSMPSDLIPSHLPPFPPPLWYPSMYPGLGGPSPHHQTPYGIDPLHFFIDLRVSGHIWDRKLPPFGTVPSSMSPPQAGLDCTIDRERRNGTPIVTELEKDTEVKSGALNLSSSSNKPGLNLLLGMKNSKHSSAFSVPEAKPLMMTSRAHKRRDDISPNANYVLQNLKRIYKSVKIEDGEEMPEAAQERGDEERESEVDSKSSKTETPEEEEGEKKGECKDLPALIGLELVVDYVKKHEPKPGVKRSTPPSTPPTGDAAPKMLAVTPEPEQAASP